MFDLQYENVDLLSLIKEVVISFQSTTNERDITFNIISRPDIHVYADQDRIGQVLINLVSNAINFSPDGSDIRITVNESNDRVSVTIADQGPGIPDKVKGKIFEKFYKVGDKPGTGLGLAISKGIIEAHKGEIRVLENAGKGGAISFTIPLNHKSG